MSDSGTNGGRCPAPERPGETTGWVKRLLNAPVAAAGALADLAIVAMLALIAAEVLSRWLIGISFQIVDEASGYLLVAATFLGYAVSSRDDALFRVEFLPDRLQGRAAALHAVIVDLAAIAFTGLVLIHLGRFVANSAERGVVSATALETPLWLPQLAMPIGLACLLCALVMRLWVDVARLARGTAADEDGRQHG